MRFDSGNAPVSRSALPPDLMVYLRQHRIQEPDLNNVTEKLLARLPPPPAGAARYELRDCGSKAVAGLQIRKACGSGVSFSLRADFKPPGAAKFRSVRLQIGRWGRGEGEKTLSAARDEAAVMRKQLRDGIDLRPPKAAAEPTTLTETLAGADDRRNARTTPTLRTALKNYLTARTGRKIKPLSPVTVKGYARAIEVGLAQFADKPLRDMAEDPQDLIDYFDALSQRAPAEANVQMRVLRAIWNKAHKTFRTTTPPPPAIFDMNEVEARDAGFVTGEVPALWRAIEAIEEPMRKKAILIFLFLGLREQAALSIKDAHINVENQILLIPWTKGKLLRLPLSRAAISLLLAPVPERVLDPTNPFLLPSKAHPNWRKRTAAPLDPAHPWRRLDKADCGTLPVPAAYIAQKGDKARCHPHVFRHTYRTLATSAGVSEVAIRLLMGHKLQNDVSFDYLTADLDWLRKGQDTISAYILSSAGKAPNYEFPHTYFLGQQADAIEVASPAERPTGQRAARTHRLPEVQADLLADL